MLSCVHTDTVLQGICSSHGCAEADVEDEDICDALNLGKHAKLASAGPAIGKAGSTKTTATVVTTASAGVPVMVVSKRKLKEGPQHRDDVRACFAACEQHMRNKLKSGLMGMYAFMDKDTENCVHDVMIFKDAGTLNAWADDMVAWPATRAGRPIQEWVTQYDSKGSPEGWWEGVVIGGHTADTQERLSRMGANLKYLKSQPNQGYIKPKLKKLKGHPVVMYNKRKLKVASQ